MKIPIILLHTLLLVIVAGCGSSPGPDSISSHTSPAAGAFPDCLVCHSLTNPSLDPIALDTVVGGSHSAHVDVNRYGFACVKCHTGYSNQSTHMNGVLDTSNPTISLVFFDSTNSSGQFSGPQIKSCSNLYCHSIVQTMTGQPLTLGSSDYKTPVWGGSLAANCTGCHDNPPAGGSHPKHAGGGVGQYTFICDTCHSGYVPPGATTHHVDGAINTAISTSWGGTYNGDTTPGTGFSNCSNTYCHSDGTSIATGAVLNNASPTWGSGPLACNSCHGYPPSYPQMTATTASPKANAHNFQNHLDVVTNTIWSCGGCHYATTTDGKTIANPSNHVNGRYNVSVAPGLMYSGAAVNFTYRPNPGGLGGYCVDVTCHGATPNSAFWGKYVPIISGITTTNGPGCFEAQFVVSGMTSVTYPVTYTWTFGDGQSESGSSNTPPSSSTHKYVDGSQRTVTITGQDGIQRYFSQFITVTPQPIGNLPPVAAWSPVTHNRYTVTVTDLSYDPDYGTCEIGPGQITLSWGDPVNGQTRESVYLTTSPLNKNYSYVYGHSASDTTYTVTHSVVDNGGASAINSPQTSSVTVPGTTTISGRITQSDGTTPDAGVTVYLQTSYGWTTCASTTTNTNGSYSFSGTGGCYNDSAFFVTPCVSPYPWLGGCNFLPAYTNPPVSINRSDVNFTASP